MPHHSADLTTRHADGAHHADLAGALEHGKHERIDHPEQADDDRQREQHIQQVQELVDRLLHLVLELITRLELRVGERAEVALQGRGIRVVDAAG